MELKIEEIVKQVIENVAQGQQEITGRRAILVSNEHYELQEFPVLQTAEDEILVKVEGCAILDSDTREFMMEMPANGRKTLGREGTGRIIKLGSQIKEDAAGKMLTPGDRVVTGLGFLDNEEITMFDLNRQNLSIPFGYGYPLPGEPANGWFSDYIILKGNKGLFRVNHLDLDERLLVEPCAYVIHALERAKETKILRFNSRIVVQGCGITGLICIAVLHAMGIKEIVAVDGDKFRMELAKEFGAKEVVDYHIKDGAGGVIEKIKGAFFGHLADFAFQCTDAPLGHSMIYRCIRKGGGLCELGFLSNRGDTRINPHFDICAKEIVTVGSWMYTARDYAACFDFLKRARELKIPLYHLITHRFLLEQINEAHWTAIRGEGLCIAVFNR